MRHSINVRHSGPPFRIRWGLAKFDTIVLDNILLAEETKIDNNTRIGLRPNISIRECITVNLDVPWEVLGVWDHDLGFGITEGNGEWVFGMLCFMFSDLLCEARVSANRFDDGAFEDDLDGW